MKYCSSIISWALKSLIIIYQYCISPILGKNCRFEPSCSMYAREAIVIHGPFYGCLLSFKRFIKCQPWGGTGYDPVPLNTEPRNKHCSMPQKAMKKLSTD